MRQKGICEECKIEYEYEYNAKYPRKYCPACSAMKKAAFEGTTEEPVPVVRVGEGMGKTQIPSAPSGNKHTTMYVSYAKDIFCALLVRLEDSTNLIDYKELMNVSIALVKQAKEAFE